MGRSWPGSRGSVAEVRSKRRGSHTGRRGCRDSRSDLRSYRRRRRIPVLYTHNESRTTEFYSGRGIVKGRGQLAQLLNVVLKRWSRVERR